MTSGAYCAVHGCNNQKTMKEISFFKLPTDGKRREDWLYMIGRPDLQRKPGLKPECHFVCHVHFEEQMMVRKPLLRPAAVPTRNLPTLPRHEPATTPTTKEDKTTQTRRKFYRDLDNSKRKGFATTTRLEIQRTKKQRKTKLKERLIESEANRKQLETEIEELKKQLEAARSVAEMSSKVSSSTEATCDSSQVKPSSCHLVDNASCKPTVTVEVKQETVDDDTTE